MTAHSSPKPAPKTELLQAARPVLLKSGYSGLSTRVVAAVADADTLVVDAPRIGLVTALSSDN
ncbi:hypothetical protein [Oceanibium sediminis]|uniref:hypothetical protein n=1 Tax=Oceanibium sediminis TaxID=2026339 RepID=UPI0013007FFD|nr:hypothetical protein [Oceanibium sediminis]